MEKRKYIVLARKYRPKKLSDIIGQTEICEIIKGAVKLDRVPHAFLFSGTRGVGKTTIARIISKIVNCNNINLSDADPCGNCSNCVSIDKENNIDVVEIDAASRTGVSDVREIIENTGYKPVEAKKKIYIIDEIHMLSKAAFNALLKTLEEPPEDVIFIFATTETEKIPVTILSRCQKFELRRIGISLMTNFLKKIAEKENLNLDDESSTLIAQASEGSVRDALSILDNVLSRGEVINAIIVKDVLGLSDNNLVIDLYKLLCKGDVKLALEKFEELYEKGATLNILAKSLMDLCFYSMKLRCGLDHKDIYLDSNTLDRLKDISQNYGIDFLTRFWELMQRYMNEIQGSFDEKQSFEMAIMRLCYVSLIPTPFEALNHKVENTESVGVDNENDQKLSKLNSKDQKIIDSKENHSVLKNNVSKKNNLAEKVVVDTLNNPKQIKPDFESQMLRFKEFVDIIESESEMQVSFHLRNSFRLFSLQEINTDKKVGEIQLESVNKSIDSKSILWKATKILEKKMNHKWIFSLSIKKGYESIAEYEMKRRDEQINEFKKKEIIKKILEIIPSSEVISIKKIIDNN